MALGSGWEGEEVGFRYVPADWGKYKKIRNRKSFKLSVWTTISTE